MRLFSLTTLVLSCAATLAAAPSVTGVFNAASWIPPNLPNSGVAQGAIFTVTGTGLGPSTLQAATSYPLPSTAGLGGTTVQVKVGGVTETCIMIYTVSNQVAALLPSATHTGAGTLTLSYQGESSSFAIQVMAADFGTFALNEGGSGPGVFTDTSYNVITMVNAAHPGETLVLWGSGLGPVTGDETEPPPAGDLDVGEVQVLVGNQLVTPLYAGRSSSPGLDQINFVVPPGITGCKTSVAVVVKGVTGNVTTLSVAPAGQTTCGDTFNALTTANLEKAVSSGSLNIAGVGLSHTVDGDVLAGYFTSFPLNSLIRSYGGTSAPSVGNCLSYEILNSTLIFTDPIAASGTVSFLDVGSQLALTGPNGNKNIDATSTGVFATFLATSSPYYLAPGDYTVANGSGGSNVAGFNWNLTLPASVVPDIPSSINRSQDLTLTWTGGSNFPVVSIVLYNGVKTTSTLKSYVYIICTAAGSAGTFTVPSAILSLLPAEGFGNPTTPGVEIEISGVASNHFNVTGSPGLDEGFFSALISTGSVAAIQ